jgi:hypothetical protein
MAAAPHHLLSDHAMCTALHCYELPTTQELGHQGNVGPAGAPWWHISAAMSPQSLSVYGPAYSTPRGTLRPAGRHCQPLRCTTAAPHRPTSYWHTHTHKKKPAQIVNHQQCSCRACFTQAALSHPSAQPAAAVLTDKHALHGKQHEPLLAAELHGRVTCTQTHAFTSSTSK